MTDKEMLGLAAKAAGIEYTEHEGALFVKRSMVHKREWSPLKDDGDALRLAVKLNIAVIPDPSFGMVHADPVCHAISESSQDYGDDPYAATRRAIVRAAAAIGEAMP